MTNEMSKKEMAEMIESLKKDNEILKSNSGVSVKNKVMDLIEKGINSIEEIGKELGISSKNVSSNLTYLRNDMKSEGKTIISLRVENKTYLSVKSFKDMGWNI